MVRTQPAPAEFRLAQPSRGGAGRCPKPPRNPTSTSKVTIMASKPKTLNDAFFETLKDVYWAEKQSVRALKKSAKAAESPELKQAFEQHSEESAGQVERLEKVFEIIGKPARTKTCEAMQGLTAEMQEDLEDFEDSPAADAVLIGCAQAIEHYEIARYGTLKTWAAQLGFQDAAQLLDETLQEEKKTDALLSQIAESLNVEAKNEGEEDEGDEEDGETKTKSKSRKK
jgi:ferritin-like metal-binding protein YciE